MGVRVDAAPFSWRDEVTGHFRGFLWDICTDALARAGYEADTVPINAGQRQDLLVKGEFDYCVSNYGVKTCRKDTVDLLCDPTTITLERGKHFADPAAGKARRFTFSPILFVANGAYVLQTGRRSDFVDDLQSELDRYCDYTFTKADTATADISKITDRSKMDVFLDENKKLFCSKRQKKKAKFLSWLFPPGDDDANPPNWKEKCKAILGVLEVIANKDPAPAKAGDTKPGLTPQIWPQRSEPDFEIWGFVKGSTIGQLVEDASERAPDKVGVCLRPLPSHTVAAKEFCSGRIYRYFGDVDLVRAALASYRRVNEVKCPVNEQPAARGTYEPYALVMAATEAHPDFPEKFTLALYSMFSDGTIGGIFNSRFGEGRQSEYLKTLFGINSIPEGVPQDNRPRSGGR